MTANQMIELMNRTPFEPLEIHQTDGARIVVEHPHLIATSPKSNSCWIISFRSIRASSNVIPPTFIYAIKKTSTRPIYISAT